MPDAQRRHPIDPDLPVHSFGGPNWCGLCDNPSDSEVAYLNFCAYTEALNCEWLCREHLYDVLAEQEAAPGDYPPSFIRVAPEWVV